MKTPVLKEVPEPKSVGRPLKVTAALIKAEQLGFQLVMKNEVETAATKNLGGRPPLKDVQEQLLQLLPATTEILRSNRKQLGTRKKRREESAPTKLQMCQDMENMMKAAATSREFKAQAVLKFNMQWKKLAHILKNKKTWQEIVDERKLGKGFVQSMKSRSCNQKSSRTAGRKFGIGMRLPGGGRKDAFFHIKLRVKRWLAKERSRCHYVDKTDLLEEFMDQCEEEALAAEKVLKQREAGQQIEESSRNWNLHKADCSWL